MGGLLWAGGVVRACGGNELKRKENAVHVAIYFLTDVWLTEIFSRFFSSPSLFSFDGVVLLLSQRHFVTWWTLMALAIRCDETWRVGNEVNIIKCNFSRIPLLLNSHQSPNRCLPSHGAWRQINSIFALDLMSDERVGWGRWETVV